MLSDMMMLGAVICKAQVQIHEDIELPLRHPKKIRNVGYDEVQIHEHEDT